MFRKVLYPTDFSDYANHIFDCLPELKIAGLKQVVLLNAIDPSLMQINGTLGYKLQTRLRIEARRVFETYQAQLAREMIEAEVIIEVGQPAHVILDVAEAQDVDLIVMGAHGRNLIEKFLLGSNVEKVLRRSQRPVLVQRCEVLRNLNRVECRKHWAQTFHRVLYPTDFSEHAQISFETILGLHNSIAEVIVLHVQDLRVMRHRTEMQLAEFNQVDFQRLKAMCADLKSAGITARARLEHGIPFERILTLAREEQASSIVIGSRGRSSIRELILGSVAENVVRNSSLPVLVTFSRQS